jgi:hypothetical protein
LTSHKITTLDRPPIEAEPGPPPTGLTPEEWDAYVIDTIRRWRNIPFKEFDERGHEIVHDPRLPF